MRRMLTVTALTLLAAAALAASAAAKEMSVSLASGPPSVGPGDPWNAKLLVHGEPDILANATPAIAIRNWTTRVDRTFPAKATGKRAADGQLVYRARVVFPSDGRWTYALIDGVTDRQYHAGTVQIGPPAAAPATPTKTPASPAATVDEPGSSGPPWAFALGGAALLLAAAGVVLAVRHRRLQATV
jgi:hypothetical protein